jgi:hypothetical protein
VPCDFLEAIIPQAEGYFIAYVQIPVFPLNLQDGLMTSSEICSKQGILPVSFWDVSRYTLYAGVQLAESRNCCYNQIAGSARE